MMDGSAVEESHNVESDNSSSQDKKFSTVITKPPGPC